jgi:16S rRNA processing protein RimM
VDKDFLTIGRLGAPKGVRGDLKLQSYSGEYAHFLKLKEVELRSAEDDSIGVAPRRLKLKVLRLDDASGSPTIAFEGYPSPEKARELTGLEIVAPRSGAAPLKSNEWYVTDLVGLSLVVSDVKLATVRSVLEGGSDPWLEAVMPAAGGNAERTALVPFRKEFIGEVDLKAGTIELLAPYLLDA